MAIEKRTYYVYRHIRNDINVPFYIGIGKDSKNYNRKSDKRRNCLWSNIYNKINGDYSIDVLLDNLTKNEALNKEKEFIALYGKICNNTGTLANILDEGSMPTEEYKIYMSKIKDIKIIKKSTRNKLTDEQKQAMSLARKGVSKKRGYTLSDDTKQKMSESHKNNSATKGYIWINNGIIQKSIPKENQIPDGFIKGGLKRPKMSDETKRKMSLSRKGINNMSAELRSRLAIGNKACLDKKWITNGITEKLIDKEETLEVGFIYGRLKKINSNK